MIVEIVFSGTVIRGPAPYGLGFSVDVPEIKVLPEASNASAKSSFLTLGAHNVAYYRTVHGRRKLFHVRGIVLPRRCPSGRLASGLQFTFEDGSTVMATRKIACPQEVRAGRRLAAPGELAASAAGARLPAGGLRRRPRRRRCDAGIRPSFSPDRLAARAPRSRSRLRCGRAKAAPPPPLSAVVVHLPAGLGLDVRGVATCPPARLRSRRAGGLSARLAHRARPSVLEVHAGSQTIPEEAAVRRCVPPIAADASRLEIVRPRRNAASAADDQHGRPLGGPRAVRLQS